MKNKSIINELFSMMKERKSWWLAWTIILLLILRVFLLAAYSNELSVFIYALF
jgi:hypothetical protein